MLGRKYQKGNSREISKVIRLLAEEEEEEEGANSLFHSHLNLLLEPLHFLRTIIYSERPHISHIGFRHSRNCPPGKNEFQIWFYGVLKKYLKCIHN